MLIKLVNPENKDDVCIYGNLYKFKISTGVLPVDKPTDKYGVPCESFIIAGSSKPTRRILSDHYEVFTNWDIYLMDDNGQTIESL